MNPTQHADAAQQKAAPLFRFVKLNRSERVPSDAVGLMSDGDFLPVAREYHGMAYSDWSGNPLGRLVETPHGKAVREAKEKHEKLIANAPQTAAELERVRAQRDDLREACRRALAYLELTAGSRGVLHDVLRAALAKATQP